MKNIVKKWLRKYCPKISFVRKKLTAIKIKEILKYSMDENDIKQGEMSDQNKAELVCKYSKMWPDYTANLNEKLDEYIKRSLKEYQPNEFEALRTRVIFDCFAYGFLPDEFFVYHLDEKSIEEKKSYISDRDTAIYSYLLNDIIEVGVFFDKYCTYQKFNKYYKREAIGIEKESDYSSFKKFLERHPQYVRKNVWLSKGDSVELVDSEKNGKSPKELFDEMLSKGKYIVEERVEQCDIMNTLNPSSVNTIRCITFCTEKGVEIGACFLKVGRGESFVDNGGAGGILIGIDSQTGILNTNGFDEFLIEYEQHPDTHTVFRGYKLPEWNKLIELLKKLGTVIPSVRYIGWDLAHTNDGWVVIEGNGSGQFIGPQIVWQRGFKHELRKIVGDNIVK